MTKIIRLDTERNRRAQEGKEKPGCAHRWVTASTASRTVYCSTCGALLDTFDVLLDMLKGAIPEEKEGAEEERMLREVEDRKRKPKTED